MSIFTLIALFIIVWFLAALGLAFLLSRYFKQLKRKIDDLHSLQQTTRSELQGRTQYNIFEQGGRS